MSRWSLILFFLTTSALANPVRECGDRIQVFNIYELRVKGKIVERHSLFPPGDWSDASAYEGIAVKSSDEADTVIFETRQDVDDKTPLASVSAKLTAWSRDKAYKTAREIEPKELMKKNVGSVRIELRKGSKVLCRWTGGTVEPH